METVLLAPRENWPAQPKFMSIRAFCKYSGVDYQTFHKWAKETNFQMHRLGNFKLVDVEQAMAMVKRETVEATS
jgi:hypothetical protein